jgi:DNA modification methylase
VTSPPYFGLRNYEGEQVVNWPEVAYQPVSGLSEKLVIDPWVGPLGAEPDIFQYIGHLVLVCREVARVLRPDGTFWFNIGDSQSGSGGLGTTPGISNRQGTMPHYPGRSVDFLEDGNAILVPFRVALALQADGWIVRRPCIWYKENPMPEPRKGWRWERPACPCVTERRETFIREHMEEQGIDRHRIYEKAGTAIEPDPDCEQCHGSGRYGEHQFRPESWRHTASHEHVFHLIRKMGNYSDHMQVSTETGANPLDVIVAQRSNYSGKHFAVFPPHLVAPLVHASVPRRCCVQCGKAWAPVLDDEGIVGGYRQTCDHPPDYEPGLVLDPFMGSGTTGMVAREFGAHFVGCDISFKYLDEQAKLRTKTGQPSKALDGLPLFEGL